MSAANYPDPMSTTKADDKSAVRPARTSMIVFVVVVVLLRGRADRSALNDFEPWNRLWMGL